MIKLVTYYETEPSFYSSPIITNFLVLKQHRCLLSSIRPTLTHSNRRTGHLDMDKFTLSFENILCSVWKNQALRYQKQP